MCLTNKSTLFVEEHSLLPLIQMRATFFVQSDPPSSNSTQHPTARLSLPLLFAQHAFSA